MKLYAVFIMTPLHECCIFRRSRINGVLTGLLFCMGGLSICILRLSAIQHYVEHDVLFKVHCNDTMLLAYCEAN